VLRHCYRRCKEQVKPQDVSIDSSIRCALDVRQLIGEALYENRYVEELKREGFFNKLL